MYDEYTMNVKRSRIALKLRELRIKGNCEYEDIATATNISVGDLFCFETDRKKPTRKQLSVLAKFYHITLHDIKS